MSVLSTLDSTAQQVLRIKLESMFGVERALLDPDAGTVWIICEPGTERVPVVPIQRAARDTLASFELDPEQVLVEIAVGVGRTLRRRVRLDRVEREPLGSGHVRVRVTLEWRGSTYSGEATGESGRTIELRTAALATLDALDPLVGESLGIRLTGIKQFRTFDEELIAVSLDRPDTPGQRYVGTVLVSSDPLRTAAMAVLNALNRLLGNYLATLD